MPCARREPERIIDSPSIAAETREQPLSRHHAETFLAAVIP
jgi:hypothetical protein